ncbi:hypothetical protein B5G34_06810 [Flavonifractor sp. An82]|uniref:DUF6612 family protein n=1 Tax=Flavonifractor sp. An82 TaxID=1965660 RepID=UPI000B382D16|nr:DUF6612 family protein [Flavonifractor sp. An82]OUN22576.1 hypothetical protein B5G34_06810 [Flavonifractor sp. An82]
MKLGKRAAALALGALLAVSMTACGNGANKEESADQIKAAMEKINAVESMDATMYMEMDMSVMGQSIETDTKMDMSCFNDPVKLKADMTMSMGSLGSVSMSIYADATDGDYTIYMFDGSSWTTQAADASQLEQYDAQQSMDLYLSSGAEYAHAGTEDINGSTADKYTGIIRGDALAEVMKASGATSSMETTMGMVLEDLYSDLGDMPITVWIDQATGYPVRYYMDMTGVMQSMMKKALAGVEGGDSLTMDKVEITMDCSNFNNVADFEIPAEALAA